MKSLLILLTLTSFLLASVLATPMRRESYLSISLLPEDALSEQTELDNQMSVVDENTSLLSKEERVRLNANTDRIPESNHWAKRLFFGWAMEEHFILWIHDRVNERINTNKHLRIQTINAVVISKTLTVLNIVDQKRRYWEELESDLSWIINSGNSERMSYRVEFANVWWQYKTLDDTMDDAMNKNENEINQTLDLHGILGDWDRCRDTWDLQMTSIRGEPMQTHDMFRKNAKFATLSTFADVALIEIRQAIQANQHSDIMRHYFFAVDAWIKIIAQVIILTPSFTFRYMF